MKSCVHYPQNPKVSIVCLCVCVCLSVQVFYYGGKFLFESDGFPFGD